MSHTNATTNYQLPQFISTDVPGWMSDVNGAMQSIDAAMHDNAVAIGQNAAAVGTIQEELAANLPAAGNTGAVLQKTATGAQWTDLVNLIYPVGSVYISTSATDPATLFGGSWQRIQDKFLLAAGSVYANGSTGGNSQHTLTVNEIPSHTHNFNRSLLAYIGGTQGTNAPGSGTSWIGTDRPAYGGNNTLATGGGQPFSTMPPYLAVVVWERIA